MDIYIASRCVCVRARAIPLNFNDTIILIVNNNNNPGTGTRAFRLFLCLTRNTCTNTRVYVQCTSYIASTTSHPVSHSTKHEAHAAHSAAAAAPRRVPSGPRAPPHALTNVVSRFSLALPQIYIAACSAPQPAYYVATGGPGPRHLPDQTIPKQYRRPLSLEAAPPSGPAASEAQRMVLFPQ